MPSAARVGLAHLAPAPTLARFRGDHENFVSKMEMAHKDRDRPEWMGTIDFSGLKIKLIASIVAISGIHLLKIFMNLAVYTEEQLRWYVIIHLTFIFSGVAVAAMDWIEEKAHAVHARVGA